MNPDSLFFLCSFSTCGSGFDLRFLVIIRCRAYTLGEQFQCALQEMYAMPNDYANPENTSIVPAGEEGTIWELMKILMKWTKKPKRRSEQSSGLPGLGGPG